MKNRQKVFDKISLLIDAMNQELTSIHQEVLQNLESIHGALLRMNRSIQSEGTFGVLKWDKSYKRLFRRGEKNVILELTLISSGFNLYKYLYCEEHGMEKYMKFTMYKKETTDKKYHENPYRAVNFAKDAYLLRNRKVNTKKRQNRHLPELAFLILGTYFTAPFLFYDAQLIESAMYVTTPRPA